MQQYTQQISVNAQGRKLYDITPQVLDWANQLGFDTGLLTLYIQHTSASLLINENYDDGTTDKLESIVLRQDIPKNQQISAIAIREASNSTDGMTTDRSSSQKLAACHASAFAFEVLARFRQVPNNNTPDIFRRL